VAIESDNLGGSWSTAGGDNARTGCSRDSVTPPLRVVWEYTDCDWIQGGIVVDEGVVVAGDRQGVLHAVSASDGSRLWTCPLGGFVTGTPAISAGHVFAASSREALCLDLHSGSPIWSCALPHVPDFPIATPGAVLVAGGRVFMPMEIGVAVFDAESGELVDRLAPGSGSSANAGVCCDEDDLYVPNERELICIVGGAVSTQFLGGKITCGPVVGGDLLLFGSNYHTVEAIKLRDLQSAWSSSGGEASDYASLLESRPAFAQGKVVFGGVDGCVYAVDAASGGPAWRTDLGADITAPVAIAGDHVYALATDGLRALRLSDGEIVWSFLAAGRDEAINSPPAVAGGMVFVAWRSLWALAEGRKSEPRHEIEWGDENRLNDPYGDPNW